VKAPLGEELARRGQQTLSGGGEGMHEQLFETSV
jgi:hypothetical protein